MKPRESKADDEGPAIARRGVGEGAGGGTILTSTEPMETLEALVVFVASRRVLSKGSIAAGNDGKICEPAVVAADVDRMDSIAATSVVVCLEVEIGGTCILEVFSATRV